MEKQRGDRRIKKKKIQKTPTILRLRPGTTKKNLLPKIVKLRRDPLHKQPVLQLTRKDKKYGSDMGPLSSHIAGHVALYGSRLLHGLENVWRTPPGDPLEDLNVNLFF